MPQSRQSPFFVFVSFCFITAVFYFGEEFLFPLTLSILLAFLLAPVVARLEMWHLGRVASVSIVALAAFSLICLAFYVVAAQLIDLVAALPGYRDNLRSKVIEPLERFSSVFTAIGKEMQSPPPPTPPGGPVPVEVVSNNFSVLGVAQGLAGSLLSPLGTAAIVLVYIIFFLFDWTSLRDRFIHLVGRGRLNVTTQAMDDAASRVSRYLGAQLIVNVSYGIPIGVGLYFIGIPNAPLWGLLTILLRFIPYIGPWIASAMPIALSIAISPSWTPPVLTIGLFVAMELLSNNVIEPWLYGASTGLSPSAIIVSATFWTWLWGAGGLLLATPLTVCFAVLGKHVPTLAFLDILLGEKPPIAKENRFYQRLLAGDDAELGELISDYMDRGATLELFDEIILPALHLADHDLRNGTLEPEDHKEIFRHLYEALGDIEGFPVADDTEMRGVAIIPARTQSDAMAGAMLAVLLRARGVACTWFSAQTFLSAVQARLAENPGMSVCLSALTSSAAQRAGMIIKRLGSTASGNHLLGFWQGDRATAVERVGQDGIEVVTTLADAIRFITATAPVQPAAEANNPPS